MENNYSSIQYDEIELLTIHPNEDGFAEAVSIMAS